MMSYEQVIENILEQGKRDIDTRAETALRILVRYGQIDGSHHKLWVIDQAVRALSGVYYDELISAYRNDSPANDLEDGPDIYEWNEGIPP